MENKQRVLNNELNCHDGAVQLLYSLAHYGLLKEPYISWAYGDTPTEGQELENYKKAIEDLSDSILVFNDEIKQYGQILGSTEIKKEL